MPVAAAIVLCTAVHADCIAPDMQSDHAPAQPWAEHHEREHTGELIIHLHAADRPTLFRAALRALAPALTGPSALIGPTRSLGHVHLTARDDAGLLVAWLNELIYIFETQAHVPTSCAVASAFPTEIVAQVFGRRSRQPRCFVKAATYSGLACEASPQGIDATIVLDV